MLRTITIICTPLSHHTVRTAHSNPSEYASSICEYLKKTLGSRLLGWWCRKESWLGVDITRTELREHGEGMIFHESLLAMCVLSILYIYIVYICNEMQYLIAYYRTASSSIDETECGAIWWWFNKKSFDERSPERQVVILYVWKNIWLYSGAHLFRTPLIKLVKVKYDSCKKALLIIKCIKLF